MKRSSLVAAITAFLALPCAAEPESFVVDPRHTFPTFEILHFGIAFQRGRFDRTSGRITLDIAARKGGAEILIETTSVSTGVDKLDERLRTEEFFHSTRFPQASFKSSDFGFEGDKLVSARGDLTLLGATKPVTFKFTHFHCVPHPMLKRKACGAEMTATIKRSEFGITYGMSSLSDEVLLRVNVEAIKDS